MGHEAGIEGAIHSVHKQINIANALSFPEHNMDVSISTVASKKILTITHATDNGPIGVMPEIVSMN